MDKAAKLDLIARFESAVDPLVDLLKSAPAAALDFRPALPGAWTLREHAIHFLDADTFAHGRLRSAIAEPGARVQMWDQEAWQAKARYESADALAALETARALRKVTSAMARALLDTDWDAYHVQHPQRGRMTLVDILHVYIDHGQAHLQYFKRNLDACRARE